VKFEWIVCVYTEPGAPSVKKFLKAFQRPFPGIAFLFSECEPGNADESVLLTDDESNAMRFQNIADAELAKGVIEDLGMPVVTIWKAE
jgi:hypothetical protein